MNNGEEDHHRILALTTPFCAGVFDIVSERGQRNGGA